jgi:ABC-2 type transport system ATP-binding protein
VCVTLEDVVVRLGRREVLKGLTWELPTTGLTLLVGRNGAGKTTTLRVASGALRPRSGAVRLDGAPSSAKQLRRAVALMPQNVTSVPGLSVAEQVAFAAWLGGLPEGQARSAAIDAVRAVDLITVKDRHPAQLSGGELRRVGLAEVLARPSDVLLLDEPTAGLDPRQRARFREIVLTVGRPIVVSTHQLDDVDTVYDHAVVLDQGRIVFTGSVEDFLRLGTGPDNARRAEAAFLTLVGAQ